MEGNLLFVGGDLSGIQKFIYNITSKRAMVSLKGRSYYLKDFTKDVYDEILDIVKNGKDFRPGDWNKELPECVRNEITFTVYRAGKESIDVAAESMSWTLWRDVAEWFAERHEHYGQGTQHLYQASISADDVIAFTNGRQEFEIIQYQGVRDIEEIPRIGVSEEYKKLSTFPIQNSDDINESKNLAVDLFLRWYWQNTKRQI